MFYVILSDVIAMFSCLRFRDLLDACTLATSERTVSFLNRTFFPRISVKRSVFVSLKNIIKT